MYKKSDSMDDLNDYQVQDKDIFEESFEENNTETKTDKFIENSSIGKETITNEEIVLGADNLDFSKSNVMASISLNIDQNEISSESESEEKLLNIQKIRDSNDEIGFDCTGDAESITSVNSMTSQFASEIVDILGNGFLTKQVITRGLGVETQPSKGDLVTISYQAWNSKNKLFEQATETVVLGDEDMIDAVEIALRYAELGEEFELVTDSGLAYGEYGMLPDVESNEDLRYRIKVLASKPSPDYSLYDHNDRMDAANKKKKRADFLYNRTEYHRAIKSYSLAIKIIETDPEFQNSFQGDSKSEMSKLFMKVSNSLAASQLKVDLLDEAIVTCDKILYIDPNNVRACFRKGISLAKKECDKEALVFLKKAYQLDCNNNITLDEITKCEDRMKSCHKCKTPSSSDGMFYKYSCLGLFLVASIAVLKLAFSRYNA